MRQRNLIVGALALGAFALLALGVWQWRRTSLPDAGSAAAPNPAGVVQAITPSEVVFSDPADPNRQWQYAISDATVIRMIRENGEFGPADQAAVVQGASILISLEGSQNQALVIDVLSTVGEGS